MRWPKGSTWYRDAVVAGYIVSPSYFGAVADVEALAEVAHSRGSS